MRIVTLCAALLISSIGLAQSKKELQAEVNRLKSQVIELKKAKDIQVDVNNPHQQASYGLGVLIASNLKQQAGDSLNLDILAVGIKDVFQGKPLKMDQQECSTIVQQYIQENMDKKSVKVKAESQAFLDKNKTNEGVQVTASGLQYKVITSGKGKAPLASDNVTVHYIGKLTDGSEFDNSVTRGEPATFGVNQVIPGWTEALQLMHEGDKWILYIPHELGYGEQGAGGVIPPFATLIFEVELIKVN
ncbi:MAG: FKBP-type peptidyl-prolyl cis-trans isomerase [Cyclobacteriaceae bacterium]|nr:FKBP-type peptidyl-prolyl cis-trans isomerase [Cyclobacteriaceae bacterium]